MAQSLLLEALVFLLVIGGVAAIQLAKRRRLASAGLAAVDAMDGETFERVLALTFARLGYAVERTPYAGDFGGDLVLERDGARTVVQAKRWRGKVGVKAVQEAAAAKGYYRCAAALMVTNSAFTAQARALAAANGVTLWARPELAAALRRERPGIAEGDAAAGPAPDGSTVLPPSASIGPVAPVPAAADTCASCGAPLTPKVRAYCAANAGRFGGKGYCYRCQRAEPKRPALAR